METAGEYLTEAFEEYPWANFPMRWAIAEYVVGNTKLGNLLIAAVMSKQFIGDCLLMRLCYNYINECYPDVVQWPNFAEVAKWAFLEEQDESTITVAQDFVALLHEPPKASPGARELFDDLTKLWQNRQ